jgi:hypothetical protein
MSYERVNYPEEFIYDNSREISVYQKGDPTYEQLGL